MSLNKAQLIGRLGQDPELKYTADGMAVANFTVATTDSYTGKDGQKKEETTWHRIVVWGKLAEICNQYISKGRQVFIEGKIRTKAWTDKDNNQRTTQEIHVTQIEFLGNSESKETSSGSNNKQTTGTQGTFANDDIGF